MHTPWDVRVSLDLFLGGVGIGAFLLAVTLGWFNREKYSGLIKITTALSPSIVGIGLLFLIWETGRPERMYLTTINMNPVSVVPWGGMAQGAFIGIAFLYSALHMLNRKKDTLFRLIEMSGVFFALTTGLFHGFLLSASGRPLWSGGMITVVFFASSLLGGTALVLILKAARLHRFLPPKLHSDDSTSNTSPDFNFPALLFGLTTINLLSLIIWWIAVPRIGLEAAQTMNLMMADFGGIFYYLAVTAGLLIPLIFSFYYAFLAGSSSKMPVALSCFMAILILAGGFAYKHAVLTAGQYLIERWL